MQPWIKNYRGFAFGIIVIAVLGFTVAAMLPFLPALLWATVLSVLTYPLYRRLANRFGRSKRLEQKTAASLASLSITIGTLVLICIPFALVALGLILQMGNFSANLNGPDFLTVDSALASVDHTLKPLAANLGLKDLSVADYVNAHRDELIPALRVPLQAFATQAGFTILTLIFALLTQFFMLRDGHRLLKPATELLPFAEARSRELFDRIGQTIHAVFVGTVLVAMIQGFVIGLTYYFVGFPNSILLGVISGILCIIPLLGAPVIYFPVAALLFFQGKTTEAFIVLGVGLLFVSQIDNLLKPFLIGGRVNLHPMAIFFAILGGVLLVGPIGVMAGPMVLTILLALQEVVRESLAEAREEPVAAIPADTGR